VARRICVACALPPPRHAAFIGLGRRRGFALLYHGWKFDCAGHVPRARPAAGIRHYAHKVDDRRYPVRRLSGPSSLAFLGDGAPPEDLPLYPEFEDFDGLVEIRFLCPGVNCTLHFVNLENALDMSHVGFVHADNRASFGASGAARKLAAEEKFGLGSFPTASPAATDSACPSTQFGMREYLLPDDRPLTANDAEIGCRNRFFWWVPIEE